MTTNTPQPRLTRAELEQYAKQYDRETGFNLESTRRLASEALALIDERDQLAHHGRNASASLEITLKENERLEAERDACRKALEQILDSYMLNSFAYAMKYGRKQPIVISEPLTIARAALSEASEVSNEASA